MIKYVETAELNLSELNPYPGNAKRGDVGKIVESLERNGQYRSLVVRRAKTGDTVLAGNHTRDALIALGLKTARCEVITCDDETARRVNLADNRTADLGQYDDASLLDLLNSLEDLSGTGYEADDLDDLIATLDRVEVAPEGQTGAHYAESEEELAARKSTMGAYESKLKGDMIEVIIIMSANDKEELAAMIRRIRKRDGDLPTGTIILEALRKYAPESDQ